MQTLLGTAGKAVSPSEVLTPSGFSHTVNYTIRPLLPEGLDLDADSGVVTGTPTTAQKPIDYTVTADDGTETASATMVISVDPVVQPAIQSVDAVVGTTIAPTAAWKAAGFIGLITYSVTPKLPDELSLDTVTGVITGIVTSQQVKTDYTITADDGDFQADALVTIKAVCPGGATTCDSNIPAVPLPLAGTDPNRPTASLLGTAPDPIHGPYQMDTDSCAGCHRTHSDQLPIWTPNTAPGVSQLCFTCHDGTGSSFNVETQYDLAQPNDPSTRAYFSHDAIPAADHTPFAALEDGRSLPSAEFEGTFNRHSQCTDCHNPHNADSTAPLQTATGWTAPGRVVGASGVEVVNGAAGTPPAYTLKGGALGPITREYQLCMKCHSGYTTLPSNSGFKPSQYVLDKGIDMNPANKSTHPVEGIGTNQTAKMTDSLAGSSPYKRWTFTTTSTIRCTNCHAEGAVEGQGASQDQAPHVSANRGILILPYRDRLLKAGTEPYAAEDSALCYACHTDVPFKTETTTATNFKFHYKHMSAIATGNGGTASIDTEGEGTGNALCAECHFRLHSTTFAVPGQILPDTRLVNFAPNVQANSGGITWESTGVGKGSCTLTCHGVAHDDFTYAP